jgi:hypothetical protein
MGEGFGWLNIQRYWFSIKAFPAGGEGEPPPKAVVDEVVPNAATAHTHILILNRPLACRQGQTRIAFSELMFAELDVGKC